MSAPTMLDDGLPRVWSVAVSPDGAAVAAGTDRGVHVRTGDGEFARIAETPMVFGLTWAPDGALFAGCLGGSVVRFDRPGAGRASGTPVDGHASDAVGLTSAADGRIASASYDDTAAIRTPSGEIDAVLRGHDGHVRAVAFTGDADTIATGSYDGTARLWDVGTAAERAAFDVGAAVRGVGVLGADVVTGSVDGAVARWSPDDPGRRLVLGRHDDAVYAVAVAPRGGPVVSGGADGAVRLHDAEGNGSTVLARCGDTVAALAATPDGGLVAGTWDGTVRAWGPDAITPG